MNKTCCVQPNRATGKLKATFVLNTPSDDAVKNTIINIH